MKWDWLSWKWGSPERSAKHGPTHHYDFGLRNMKSVLDCVAALKRKAQEASSLFSKTTWNRLTLSCSAVLVDLFHPRILGSSDNPCQFEEPALTKLQQVWHNVIQCHCGFGSGGDAAAWQREPCCAPCIPEHSETLSGGWAARAHHVLLADFAFEPWFVQRSFLVSFDLWWSTMAQDRLYVSSVRNPGWLIFVGYLCWSAGSPFQLVHDLRKTHRPTQECW